MVELMCNGTFKDKYPNELMEYLRFASWKCSKLKHYRHLWGTK
jgi:hypothetical protein